MTAGPATEPDAPRRSLGGAIVPLLLIALGAAFLAANLGYLPPLSIRAVLGLWPLVLILVGLEILLARRQPVLALALQVAVIGLGIALVSSQGGGLFALGGAASGQESVARDGAASLDLHIDGSAGDFTVGGGATALVDARSTGSELRVRTERRGGDADVRIEQVHDHFRWTGDGTALDVKVAGDVPVKVSLDAGAGNVRLDLRTLRVTEASVEAGAGEIHVVVPTPRGDVPIRIEAGAAEIVIEVPEGVEARVSVTGGAVSTDSDNARLRVDAGRAETAGYASATDRVTVTVQAGAASVHIR